MGLNYAATEQVIQSHQLSTGAKRNRSLQKYRFSLAHRHKFHLQIIKHSAFFTHLGGNARVGLARWPAKGVGCCFEIWYWTKEACPAWFIRRVYQATFQNKKKQAFLKELEKLAAILKNDYFCNYNCNRIFMTTVIIDTRTKEAKKIVEFLRSTRYARVFEENEPNEETIQAMNEVAEGKVKTYKSAKDMIESLKKAADVYD
jgi:hypothetical protein